MAQVFCVFALASLVVVVVVGAARPSGRVRLLRRARTSGRVVPFVVASALGIAFLGALDGGGFRRKRTELFDSPPHLVSKERSRNSQQHNALCTTVRRQGREPQRSEEHRTS